MWRSSRACSRRSSVVWTSDAPPASASTALTRCGARRPARRVLRQDRERHGFRQRQLARILAEVDEARRRGALEVAAVGDEVEIRLQDLSLGVAELELQRAPDLSQFAAGRGGANG